MVKILEIKEVDVKKIKPDPKQPRRSIDQKHIDEMAQSIATTGVINAIEIDPNFVIVTGEMRWHAATLAGLKTILCKIIEIDPEERHLRQVIENVHHNTMTPLDTAQALKKVMADHIKESGQEKETGVRALARLIGKSKDYVYEYISLLESSSSFQRAINEGVDGNKPLPLSMLRAVRATPPEFQKQMERKIVHGDFESRDAALKVARAISANPDKAEELLGKKYNTPAEVNQVKSDAPTISQEFDNSTKIPKRIGQLTLELTSLLKDYPPARLGSFHVQRVFPSLMATKESIEKWQLQIGQKTTVKELE